MSTEEGTEVDNHIKAAPIYDDAQLTAMAQDSDYLSIDMETVESLLATAIHQRERANKADEEIARLTAITVAYWARFGAVPEDGANILAARDAEIARLREIAKSVASMSNPTGDRMPVSECMFCRGMSRYDSDKDESITDHLDDCAWLTACKLK